MNRHPGIAVILSLSLLASVVVASVITAPPLIKRPMDLYEVTIQGRGPQTVDYSWAYDTASSEILQNCMDTLVAFNGEHIDQYIGRVATNWTSFPLGPGGIGIDSGNPISGLNFENPANQSGPNATYYYRYVFQIRTGITFQPPYNYSLTGEDIAYSFQRTMIAGGPVWTSLQVPLIGPQWMLQEPLLDNGAGDDAAAEAEWVGVRGIADLTNQTQVNELGHLIEDSVQYNSTHVWFNLMFPGAYAPFMQILSQTWSSIESKQWINNQVIKEAGRLDWNGDWSNLTAWVAYYNPPVSPLDQPTPMLYGSGPFKLLKLDQEEGFWEATRYVDYWAGWPADYPSLAGASPGGYVDTIHVSWAFDWPTAEAMFKNGDADFVTLPQVSYIPELYQNSTGPYQPPNYPLAGIRCVNPLPQLGAYAFFFTFNINSSTPYGPINPAGVFNETAIPRDFFGNPTWGINVRKGFAQAFDYNSFVATAFLGEATVPATAIIPGLPYYDPSVTGYSYNPDAANASFNQVPGLSTTGFTITMVYGQSNLVKRTAVQLLKSGIENLNPKYHVNALALDMVPFWSLVPYQDLPIFMSGWLADFPDPHDFALGFYASSYSFSMWQAYFNATMDALINKGIATPDGPARQAIYTQIQELAIADCPSFMIYQRFDRHFERDWVQGWYYNPVYPGIYFYNLWKWYYEPASQLNTTSQPAGYNLPADVNHDGNVDMRDMGTVARSFGAAYGPPISSRWFFTADVNLDRKIDMKDIGYVAKQFGKSSPNWTPS